MKKPVYRCDGKVPDCAKTTCGYITKDFENGCFLTSNKEHGLYKVDIRNDQDPMLSIFGISKDDLRKCMEFEYVKEMTLKMRTVCKEVEPENTEPGVYVGLKRGPYYETKINSNYYCGRCGWKVTDHDSFCPECGGALHKKSSGA